MEVVLNVFNGTMFASIEGEYHSQYPINTHTVVVTVSQAI